VNEQTTVPVLYSKLLRFYPRRFHEQLGESMEQTFQDLYRERRGKSLFGFVLWTFLETASGIFREHLLLISPGDIMQSMLKTMGSSTLMSFSLIIPFMIMEVVNRRNFNEGFPFVLFFVMWFNLFAISLILLPILRARWTGNHDMGNSAPTRGNTVLTNPRWAAISSIALILFPSILLSLDSLGWLSMDRLVNGPNPEVAYLTGLFISLGLIMFPVAAGIIAAGPIVSTLQTGGRLLTHPIHLIIVVLILSMFVAGFSSLLIDQWPCFIGVPNCD
jgi:hypothetical protein